MSDLTFWRKASAGEARAEITRETSLEAEDDGRTPLHEAAAYNTVDVVRLLVEQGLDVTAQDANGDTALHFAAGCNPDPGVVILLLERGADVNTKNKQGETPLHKAAESNDEPRVMKALLEPGADVNAKNEQGETPLHKAAESNDEPRVVRVLLEGGADRDARTNKGHTACRLAVSRDADGDMRLMLCTSHMSVDQIMKFLDMRDKTAAAIRADTGVPSKSREYVDQLIARGGRDAGGSAGDGG